MASIHDKSLRKVDRLGAFDFKNSLYHKRLCLLSPHYIICFCVKSYSSLDLFVKELFSLGFIC